MSSFTRTLLFEFRLCFRFGFSALLLSTVPSAFGAVFFCGCSALVGVPPTFRRRFGVLSTICNRAASNFSALRCERDFLAPDRERECVFVLPDSATAVEFGANWWSNYNDLNFWRFPIPLL